MCVCVCEHLHKRNFLKPLADPFRWKRRDIKTKRKYCILLGMALDSAIWRVWKGASPAVFSIFAQSQQNVYIDLMVAAPLCGFTHATWVIYRSGAINNLACTQTHFPSLSMWPTCLNFRAKNSSPDHITFRVFGYGFLTSLQGVSARIVDRTVIKFPKDFTIYKFTLLKTRWSSGQHVWLLIMRLRVRSPALPQILNVD